MARFPFSAPAGPDHHDPSPGEDRRDRRKALELQHIPVRNERTFSWISPYIGVAPRKKKNVRMSQTSSALLFGTGLVGAMLTHHPHVSIDFIEMFKGLAHD